MDAVYQFNKFASNYEKTNPNFVFLPPWEMKMQDWSNAPEMQEFLSPFSDYGSFGFLFTKIAADLDAYKSAKEPVFIHLLISGTPDDMKVGFRISKSNFSNIYPDKFYYMHGYEDWLKYHSKV